MKCLIGLPLLIRIELLGRSRSWIFKNRGVGVRGFVYWFHSPGYNTAKHTIDNLPYTVILHITTVCSNSVKKARCLCRENMCIGALHSYSFHECYFQGEAVPILGSFLRKNQRALKLSTLTLLDTLVRNYSSALSTELLNKVSLCLWL
jgi:hypothetical protein